MLKQINFSKRFKPQKSTLQINLTKKHYNGLFERPTQNILSHIAILGSIEAIQYTKFNFDLSWSLSIALTSAAIRLLQIPTYWLIKDIKVDFFLPNSFVKFANKWHHRLILNDLLIDTKRNKFNQIERDKMIKFYDANLILSYMPGIFFLFNYFRGLNSMSKASSLYPGFSNDLFGINLAIHDSFFILPIFVFISNFFFLKVSNHPWLININKTQSKLIYLSFTLSLFSVFWPQSYIISWVSYCLTHIIITKVSNYIIHRRENKMSYQVYLERNYKKKIEELYKKF